MALLQSATISSGESVLTSVSVVGRGKGLEIGSLVLDGTYTNTSFDLQAEIDGTWHDIFDTYGTKFSVSVADGKHSLPADVFKDVNKVRVKGASNEGAERTVKF